MGPRQRLVLYDDKGANLSIAVGSARTDDDARIRTLEDTFDLPQRAKTARIGIGMTARTRTSVRFLVDDVSLLMTAR